MAPDSEQLRMTSTRARGRFCRICARECRGRASFSFDFLLPPHLRCSLPNRALAHRLFQCITRGHHVLILISFCLLSCFSSVPNCVGWRVEARAERNLLIPCKPVSSGILCDRVIFDGISTNEDEGCF